MKNNLKNKFPNDITSYLETFYEISIVIYKQIDKENGFVWKRYINQGTGGIYELVEELTDEFELKHKNEKWINKDFFEEIDLFLSNKEQ